MYPKQDRERILADFFESGMHVATFARQPGNPSRTTLREWIEQAERGELDIPSRKIRGRFDHLKHSRYPEATKKEALSLFAKGMRPADIARRLGIESGSIVSQWAKKAAKRSKMSPKGAMRMDANTQARIAQLEAELADAKMENAALKEMVRDPKAGDPASLSNRQKAGLGERLRKDCGFRLKEVLIFLSMSKSSYEYARRSRERIEKRRATVAERVRIAFEASGRTYGYRRVRASIVIGADGHEPMNVSEREVRYAMRQGGMEARRTRHTRRWSSYKGEVDNRPANVPLQKNGIHNFIAPKPWQMIVTDVTEFKVRDGKAYLSPILDCFDGEPAAWSIARRPTSQLTDSSLESYLARKPKNSGSLVEHSDGGGTYRSHSWKMICSKNGIIRSMSRKGCCPDNARAEGFFGTLKEEFYNNRNWSQVNFKEFKKQLDGYLTWYIYGRLKAFREEGRTVYDTIANRRKRLGYEV